MPRIVEGDSAKWDDGSTIGDSQALPLQAQGRNPGSIDFHASAIFPAGWTQPSYEELRAKDALQRLPHEALNEHFSGLHEVNTDWQARLRGFSHEIGKPVVALQTLAKTFPEVLGTVQAQGALLYLTTLYVAFGMQRPRSSLDLLQGEEKSADGSIRDLIKAAVLIGLMKSGTKAEEGFAESVLRVLERVRRPRH